VIKWTTIIVSLLYAAALRQVGY